MRFPRFLLLSGFLDKEREVYHESASPTEGVTFMIQAAELRAPSVPSVSSVVALSSPYLPPRPLPHQRLHRGGNVDGVDAGGVQQLGRAGGARHAAYGQLQNGGTPTLPAGEGV